MDLLQFSDFSNPAGEIALAILDAVEKQNVQSVRHILDHGCQALPGIMTAACFTGNIEIVEMLAKAWKGQPGGAIGGHGMDAVLDRHDKDMFYCLIRNNLLSKVAVDMIALRLGMMI